MKLLQQVNEMSRDMTYDQLKVGKEYTLEDEMGEKFRAKITKIEPSRDGSVDDVAVVHYVYVDDSYSKVGKKDAFEVDMNARVFSEAVEKGKPISSIKWPKGHPNQKLYDAFKQISKLSRQAQDHADEYLDSFEKENTSDIIKMLAQIEQIATKIIPSNIK